MLKSYRSGIGAILPSPLPWQGNALLNELMPHMKQWRERRNLNPRPLDWQSNILTNWTTPAWYCGRGIWTPISEFMRLVSYHYSIPPYIRETTFYKAPAKVKWQAWFFPFGHAGIWGVTLCFPLSINIIKEIKNCCLIIFLESIRWVILFYLLGVSNTL